MSGDMILTFNAGSSTIKLGFYRIEDDRPVLLGRGVIDFRDEPLEVRLNIGARHLTQPLAGAEADDITSVLYQSFGWIADHVDLERVAVIGHRVVHGGDVFAGPTVIADDTLAQIHDLATLAPLHQPQSLRLIKAMRTLRPDVMQTASFDTAFHASNDPLLRRFAIPRALHDAGIKRYGFHGLSYRYIAGVLAQRDDLPPDAKVIVAHLGSGASLCAIAGGISRDTSMGFSTIDGIPMATRCGALDPGVLLHLLGPMGKSLAEVEDILYRQSGLLGVSGFEADSRELLASDRPEAAEAIELFCARIAGEVARLAVSMGGLDAIVFTAGVGEHQPKVREHVAARLGWLGLTLDPALNDANQTLISADDSRIRAYMIPTDEEQIIAQEALELWAQV